MRDRIESLEDKIMTGGIMMIRRLRKKRKRLDRQRFWQLLIIRNSENTCRFTGSATYVQWNTVYYQIPVTDSAGV